jgi:DNA methylase
MDIQPLIDAINYKGIVAGLTHDFYRYPARFSPLFARAAIQAFTEPGDTILDPFMGSSTSLVEALAMGRHAIGTDISSLSVFLARVKTSLLSQEDLDELVNWAFDMTPELSPRNPVVRHADWQEMGYQINLPWRFRKVAEQAINSAADLPEHIQPAARCVVLKAVQWAVDCKKRLPTAGEFRDRVIQDISRIFDGLNELRDRVGALGNTPTTIEAHQCAAADIGGLQSNLLRRRPPKLVVTSPPYPGVHVLYHRWQVLGRRETPAPFWIADCQDGQGGAHYTFGDRRRSDHDDHYFARLQMAFDGIRKVVRDDCIVAQLVGFARPDEQLPLYLTAMEEAGFQEHDFGGKGQRPSQEKFWRAVPNRKWYTWLTDKAKQTSEILLIHRKAG